MITFDTRELDDLAEGLGLAGARAVAGLAPVLVAGATAVRNDLRRSARRVDQNGRLRSFSRAITFDVRGLTAEIGPDKRRRQGALGNLLYYGTSRSGPVLEHPAVVVERHVEKVGQAAAGVVAAVVVKAR